MSATRDGTSPHFREHVHYGSDTCPSKPLSARNSPVSGWEPIETPIEAREREQAVLRARWAAQDALEEEGWRKQERWLASIEGREPDFGPQTAAKQPSDGFATVRDTLPAPNPDRPSQTPGGRRLRHLRDLVRAGKFASVEDADAATPRRRTLGRL